jgi:hypothetical protein
MKKSEMEKWNTNALNTPYFCLVSVSGMHLYAALRIPSNKLPFLRVCVSGHVAEIAGI